MLAVPSTVQGANWNPMARSADRLAGATLDACTSVA